MLVARTLIEEKLPRLPTIRSLVGVFVSLS